MLCQSMIKVYFWLEKQHKVNLFSTTQNIPTCHDETIKDKRHHNK